MREFTLVHGDSADPMIPNVQPLADFLTRYLPESFDEITPSELLKSSPIETKYLLITLPSSINASHISRIRAKKVFLLDYLDSPGTFWHGSDMAFLRSLTDRYLKTNIDNSLDLGMKMGLLPVPLRSKIGKAYQRWQRAEPFRRAARCFGRNDRVWDVALHGAATFLDEMGEDGKPRRYHQRVEWLREVKKQSGLRFWGGLYEMPYYRYPDLEADCGPVSELAADRMHHRTFFNRMARTKVSLCPVGHARWTYRHYESVYAGCEIISSDVTQIQTLLPMPMGLMDIVPDRASVVPCIENALAHWNERRDRRAAALEFCEQYLYRGCYDRRRPALVERFLAHLEG